MLGLLALRDFKGPVITVECKPCGQQGELDRNAPGDEACHIERPLPGNMLVIASPQAKPKPDAEGLLL